MSTPTSSSLKRPLPASGSNNPSTPANATSGTTPRSAATPSGNTAGFRSPAASRAAPGKSPKPFVGTPSAQAKALPTTSTANTPQLGSSHGNKTVPTGSTSLSHSSPAALDGTPSLSTGMAAGIASPSLQDGLSMGMSMSSMGVAMGLSASTLGVGLAGTSSMGPGRMGDEERRRRLEAVLHTLGQRTGRVSQQGLEHLGKRLGLEPGWEIFPEAKVGAGRMLSFAGASIQVDVEFSEKPGETDSVTRAALTYHGLDKDASEDVEAAGRIMQRDLTPSRGEASITLTLDRFAANLERLSRMDKLSVAGASCFEAVHGVYTSLKKLYDHEKKAARTVLGDEADDDTLDLHVMCNKSGSPRLHARRHLGVQLEYWRSRHLVPQREKAALKHEDDHRMDIDDSERPDSEHHDSKSGRGGSEYEDEDDAEDVFALSIECDQSPPGTFQAIRTSTQWISDRIERPPDEVETAMADAGSGSLPAMELDWQEPPLVAPPNDAPPSRARFVARLNPPLLVPSRIAVAVYATVGVDISHEVSNVAWHAAVLGRLDAPLPAAGSPFRQSFRRRSGHAQQQDWRLNLTIPRAEPGRFLDVLPFHHPKQLVSLLPVLRQYAFFGQLLRNSFEVGKALQPDGDSSGDSQYPTHNLDGARAAQNPDRDDLDALMADSDDDVDMSDEASDPVHHLDVNMRTDGMAGPHLSLALAPARSKSVTYLGVDVAPGGVVVVSERGQRVGIVDEKKQSGGEAALAKGLMVAEDLAMWAAWAKDKALPKRS